MKVLIVLCLVAFASASWVGHGWNAAAHISSGSVSVSHDGAVIAGPSGSIHTDNGLSGHGAGARVSGPAGDVGTHGGHAALSGPGIGHGGWGHGGWGNGWGVQGGVISHGLVGYGNHGGW